MKILINMFHGLCMALADSVPGVSGGTIAFIMGFYDDFIGSINDLVFGDMEKKKKGFTYLFKLGIGWIIGFGCAVVVLTSLFESHIYIVSSVFIGFIAASIPLVVMEEKESFKAVAKGIIWLIIGAALVVAISYLNNGGGNGGYDLSQFSFVQAVELFFIGMIAICAMFLPGISGSTLLLIFGAYMPVMTAVRGLMGMNLSYLPTVIIFACGIIVGACSVVKLIKYCLDHFRTQTVYAIIGMMIGSFYAICMGPTTLDTPQAALSLSTFNWLACIIGIVLVLALQWFKSKEEKQA